jgi:hypothetical protein
VYCSSHLYLMEANCYFNFVKEQNVVCFKLQSQNWQYELINHQSHDVYWQNGASLCMAFYMRIHYCAQAAQLSRDNTEPCRQISGTYSIFHQYTLYIPNEHCSWLSWHLVSHKCRQHQNLWISIFEIILLHEFAWTWKV